MTRPPGPALIRRELGERLRTLRLAARLTLDEVAARLMISTTKLSRLETAERPPNLRDVRDLADLYGLGDADREVLMRLARASLRDSSWRQYGDRISDYAELEEAAIEIIDYESGFVPALLQTAEYADALALGTEPDLSTEKRAQAVKARMDRQRRLFDPEPVSFRAVIDEGALHRVVGGAAVMREQLETLVARAQLPHVTIRVLPFEAGPHPGLDSTFIILTFGDTTPVSDLVFVEGLVGSIFQKSPRDLERYRKAYGLIEEKALTPEASVDKLASLALEFADFL